MTGTDKTAESLATTQAKESLAIRGLQFSEDHFLRHVRSGNMETVSLYLQAGISPNTRLDGETALAASANAGYIEITRLLLESGANPMGLTEGLNIRETKKDLWERLSSLSGVFTFVSSLVVASVGWYFTNAYNTRQLDLTLAQSARDHQNKECQNRLAEMQTVEKMIPHLTKDEASKRAALIAISALATPKLAAQIAEAYGGQGSIDALTQLASSGKGTPQAPAVAALTNLAKVEQGSAAKPAHDALARVLAGKEKAIVKLLATGSAFCNGFVVDGNRGWIVTPRYCVQDLKTTPISIQFDDGSQSPVQNAVFSQDGLIALLRVGKTGLQDIQLSKAKLGSGSTVTQLAFNLARNQLGITLGRVVESGPMSFIASGREQIAASAPGLKVRLAAKDRELQGTAGGPLLDSEGNAACMTFQSTTQQLEQCIAADAIAEAIKGLPR